MGKLKAKNGRVDGNSTLIHFYHMSDYSLHSTILFYKTLGGLPCHFMASGVPLCLWHGITMRALANGSRGPVVAAPSRAQDGDTNVLWHSQPIPSTPQTCQVTWHRSLSPRSTHRQVTPAPNMLWHLLRDPRWEAMGFFMDLQIILYFSAVSLWSAFLARHQAPAPAASVTHPGRQQPRRGRITQAGKPTPWLCCVLCLQWQQQLFLLIGGKDELVAPSPGSSCPCHSRGRSPWLLSHSQEAAASCLHSACPLPALCLHSACTVTAVPPGLSSCPQNEQIPVFFRLKDPGAAPHESAPLRDFKGHQRAFCTGLYRVLSGCQ